MNTLPRVYVGVDVSKNSLDVYINPIDKFLHVRNTKRSVTNLLSKLKQYDVQQIVCESSGGYESLLLREAASQEIKTWQIDPKRIKAFIASEGILAKTDLIDAKMIALFASQKQRRYEPSKEASYEHKRLRAWIKRKNDLIDMIANEKKRLKLPDQDQCKKHIQDTIIFLDKQKCDVEKLIAKLIKDNKVWSEKKKLA